MNTPTVANLPPGAPTQPIRSVPTNIITGFLGAGKTTVILNLLKNKPAAERWAVLVNEFGEIGVDGALIEGQQANDADVFVREVPGGCMCCAAGLPMQIALTQLLRKAKPDRLLIEPTGLGHPKEVLQVLMANHNKDLLAVQKCITLVDARKIADRRYTEHDIFNQQIDIADVVVASKQDQYAGGELEGLKDYVVSRNRASVPVIGVAHGNLNLALLSGESLSARFIAAAAGEGHHHGGENFEPMPLPESGVLRADNSGVGHRSVGWRFAAEKVFDYARLYSWLCGLEVERLKGVFITSKGVFGYNFSGDALTEMVLDDCLESRVEVILANRDAANSEANDIVPQWEADLLACLRSSG
ncbi:GTP-binding protein [Teredinibacter turnerae]|uniref:CobW family GTP-binding protein n=1 Tax=Teredinibacter turnerae TaxID=2426 RepID=UPI0030D4DCDA